MPSIWHWQLAYITSITETFNISNYTNLTSYRLIFIQYIAWNRPQCSLRGLHIRITWFSLYGIRIPLIVFLIWYPYALISLYGNTAHCSVYDVAMGCYGLFIVTRTVIVTSQWHDRYCFTKYARTWARHPTALWQRECTAITDCQSIDYL